MELHGDDWDPQWDAAGRKAAWRFYGWQFWCIVAGAALVIWFLV